MADEEDAVSYFEAMDAVADEVQRDGRVMHALERAGATTIRDAYAALTPHQRARYVRLTSSSNLSSDAQLALARLVGTAQGEAMRDDEAVERARAPCTPPIDLLAGSELADIIDETMAWGALPSVPVYVPTRDRGAQELLRLKPGAIIALIGGTGGGKTSLALEMYRCHAKWTGPAAFFGLELNLPETGARLAGQHHQAAWLDAASLTRAELEDALAIPRAHVWGRMGLADIEARLDALRVRYGDQPLFVVIDYAQILLDDVTERLAFAMVLERVRKMVQRTRVVAVLTSQSSRAGSRDLRAGEKLGKDTEDAGAESAQLERMAYVTLAIGGDAEHDGHGWYPKDLSIGKSRMGTGDVVVPMAYHGISGRFAWAGEAVPAAKAREAKAETKAEDDRLRADRRHEKLVRSYLARQPEPVSRTQVEEEAGGRKQFVAAALRRMLASGEVVEVGEGARKGHKPKLVLASTPRQPPANPPDMDLRRGQGGPHQHNPPVALMATGVVDGGPAKTHPKAGGLEVEEETEWEPSAQCKTFAAQRGIDIGPLVAAVHAGPPVRDPDAALMAALVRASMAGVPPDATGASQRGASQRGFLGFGPARPKGKP